MRISLILWAALHVTAPLAVLGQSTPVPATSTSQADRPAPKVTNATPASPSASSVTNPTETVRLWLTALSTPTIAGLGIWIALQQYRLQRYRLRHDVTERRLAVFIAVRDFIRSAVVTSKANHEALIAFDTAVTGSIFLFGDDVTTYLQSLRKKYCQILEITDEVREKDYASDEERRDRLKERREHRQWMREQLVHAEMAFLPYLDLRDV